MTTHSLREGPPWKETLTHLNITLIAFMLDGVQILDFQTLLLAATATTIHAVSHFSSLEYLNAVT